MEKTAHEFIQEARESMMNEKMGGDCDCKKMAKELTTLVRKMNKMGGNVANVMSPIVDIIMELQSNPNNCECEKIFHKLREAVRNASKSPDQSIQKNFGDFASDIFDFIQKHLSKYSS